MGFLMIFFTKKSYLNEEVNRTVPTASVSVPFKLVNYWQLAISNSLLAKSEMVLTFFRHQLLKQGCLKAAAYAALTIQFNLFLIPNACTTTIS
jgi:hypothetical protein